MTPTMRTIAWNFAQGVVTSLLLAAFFLTARLHVAGIPYNVGGYCRACAKYSWAWVCALHGCW